MIDRDPEREALDVERSELLRQIERWLETPMIVLAFVWLALLVVELTRGLTRALETLVWAIWVIFLIDFALRFTLAPRKLPYLRRNWLTAVALAAPALRVLRLARMLQATRAVRGFRLVRVVGSLNRGMRSLSRSMARRGFGYVAMLTALIAVGGGAGMYAFESGASAGFDTYASSVWWTAMMLTSIGSEYWPRTAEGRLLCLLIALYGFGVFGYVTASLASFFVGRDAERDDAEIAGAGAIHALRGEIERLRAILEAGQERPGASE